MSPPYFRCIDQAAAGVFPLEVGQIRVQDTPSRYDKTGASVIVDADLTAIGVIGVASCVGVYFQVNDHGK